MNGLFDTILVATEGSENGDRAVAFAVELAREHGGTLTIAHAVDASAVVVASASEGGLNPQAIVDELDDAAKQIVARASERAAAAGVSAAACTPHGRPAEAVVAAAHERRAGTIVVGTQGKRGLQRMVLGSVAVEILRRSDIPVFVVPPNCDGTSAKIERIMVALDGSDTSDAALEFAMVLAAAEHATLVLCNAIDTRGVVGKSNIYGYDALPVIQDMREAANEMLARCGKAVAARGLAYERTIVDGVAPHAIVSAAKDVRADAIVIGTHGRTGLPRMFLGSVAEGVTREATVPVAVVRTVRVHDERPAVENEGALERAFARDPLSAY
jgi:nucleotide-binding universal stress UspA family protein